MSHPVSNPSPPRTPDRLLPAGQRAGQGSLSAAAYIESDNIVKHARVERGEHPQGRGEERDAAHPNG